MTRNASRHLATGVWVSMVGMAVMGVVNFLTRRHLALVLNLDTYGFFYVAFAAVNVIVTLVGGGLGHTTTILVARYRVQNRPVRASSLLVSAGIGALAVGAVTAVVVFALRSFLLLRCFGYPAGGLALSMMALSIPFGALLCVMLSALNAVKDYVARNVIYVLQYAAVFVAAWLGASHYGASGPAAGMAAGTMGLCIVAGPYLVWRHGLGGGKLSDPAIHGEVWRFSQWTILSMTGMLLMTSVDQLMLPRLAGVEYAGLYNIALPVVQIVMMAMVIPMVISPIASDLWHGGQHASMVAIGKFVVSAMVLYTGVLAVVVVPLATDLIALLFSSEFVAAAPVLAVLAVGAPVLILAQFFMNILAAIGRPREAALVALAGVATDVVLNAVLIPRYGVVGAAVATVSGYVILLATAYVLVARHVAIPWWHREARQLGGASLAAAVLAVGLTIRWPDLPRLGAVIAGMGVLVLLGGRAMWYVFRQGVALVAGTEEDNGM